MIISRSVKYSRIIKSGAADKILPRRPLIKYKILLAGGSDFNHMSNLLFEEFRLKTGTSPASKRSSFMRGFYGSGGRKAYFEGWYIKQQANDETIAFIPSFHVDEKGGVLRICRRSHRPVPRGWSIQSGSSQPIKETWM